MCAWTPVRDWRSTFMRDGVAGIERHLAPGCSLAKAEALAVANELFDADIEIINSERKYHPLFNPRIFAKR